MNRLRRPFSSLYWRLIVSYFLVTLVAVLTVEAAGTLAQIVSGYQSYSQSTPLEVLLQKEEAPKVAPFLEQSTPDMQALQTDVLIPLLSEATSYADSDTSFVSVLNDAGRTVVATSCTWSPTEPPSPQKSVTTAGDCKAASTEQVTSFLSAQAVQDAIHAAQDAGPKSNGRTDVAGKMLSIVVPVVAANKDSGDKNTGSAGEMVVIFQNPVFKGLPIASESDVSFGNFLSQFLDRLDPAGFYFLLLATLVGTFAGALISLSLTRRLRRIAQAADSWSQGELEVRAGDRSRDEIGQLAHDLNSMAEQLGTLLTTREQLAIVEERNRLARELHDSVKQQVYANALLVRAARKILIRDTQQAEKYLEEAEDLADEAQQGLVELIQALRPASIADKGLAAVLRDNANDWSKRMGISVDVRIEGERTTPLEVEEALYRVGQESLANIARHSSAQEVSLHLEWNGEGVCLTALDNGKGFDVKRAEGKGLGLASMRERVEALHGKLMISSSPDGTVVQACVPLPATTMTQAQGLAEAGRGRA